MLKSAKIDFYNKENHQCVLKQEVVRTGMESQLDEVRSALWFSFVKILNF